MPAIPEAARSDEGSELAEGIQQLPLVEVRQTKGLQARTIDELAAFVQTVHAGKGSGVFAAVEGFRDLPCRGLRFRNEGIGEGRLAHAGLPHEDAAMPKQAPAKGFHVGMRRQLEDVVTEAGKTGQGFAGRGQAVVQIGLVEDDQARDILAFGCTDAARQQFVAEAGFSGNDQHQLGHIGSDQLLFPCVRPVEQAVAFEVVVDDAHAVSAALDMNPVSARKIAAFTARKTKQPLTACEFHFVLAPESCDDLPG